MKKRINFVDNTQYKFLGHFVTASIIFIGTITSLSVFPFFRTLAVSIFASSGILAIIIGFACQQALSNIISGIFIAIFKPVRIGDRIKLIDKNIIGYIEDINIRHTILKTFENKRIVIPNNEMGAMIIENDNLIEDKVCNFYRIGISYDSNIKKAVDILQELIASHKLFLDNRTKEEKRNGKPLVQIVVEKYASSSIILKAAIWSANSQNAYNITCDINYELKDKFENENIKIPFPHLTINK